MRAVVNHIASEFLWVPEMMAGKTVADVGDRLDGDVLGDDPVRTLVEAQRAAVASFEAPGALNRTVHLSFGDVSATDYATQMAIDSVIHSWDLARGIGGDETLDPELVSIAHRELERSVEDWRAAGAFGPACEPADDSVQARLMALTGR